ncbi:hypothetical protein B7463_g2233, partial [Scytalidium lignicola]
MRPVNSCLLCRKRRLRCDKERPSCGRCVTGRVICQYDDSTSTEPSEGPDIIRPTSGPQSTARSSISESSSQERHGSIEKGHVSVSRGGRSSYKGATFWANAIPPEFVQDDDYICDTPPRGTTPFSKWPPRRNSDVRERNESFLPPRPSIFPLPDTSSRQCRYCGSAYRLSCIQSMLPNRTICEKLCDVFFATVFPLMPILHMPDFVNDFETFWRETETRHHHESVPSSVVRAKPSFLCLLPAILFAALSSSGPARIESILGEGEPDIPSAADMYFVAMTCATLTGFPRSPTLYSLAAYIIIQSQFIREEEFSDSPDFIGTAFRLALGMGLHRHLPHAGFTLAELEARRRLWWYILHLDVMASASSGISPLFIDDKMANADMIHQYDETVDESGQNVKLTDVRYVVAVKRYEVTKQIRLILRFHFEDAFDSPTRLDDTLLKLQDIANQVNQTVEWLLSFGNLPELSRNNSHLKAGNFGRVWKIEAGTADKEVNDFASWSALLLHMMIHKAYCILYHPLFRNATSVTGIPVRENAIKHAQGFLQLFIRVCDDPISEPFHWMYPGTYQPFQALALLLADLLQYPYSDEASLSRGIVDAVFYLYRVDEGVVSQIDPPRRQLSSTGRSAWSMLSRTRKRVLEMIGDDHHVLLPSPLIAADNCVCGERIARKQDLLRQGSAELQTQGNSSTPRPFYEDPLTMPQGLYSNEFDWHEFETSIAPEAGFMSVDVKLENYVTKP